VSLGAVIAVTAAMLVGLAAGVLIARRIRVPAGPGASRPAVGATMTVAETLSRTVSLAPVGMVVVDSLRDVVVSNRRAAELGLVRDGLLTLPSHPVTAAATSPARIARAEIAEVTTPAASSSTRPILAQNQWLPPVVPP